MDPTMATQWCRKQNGQPGPSVVLDVSGVTREEKQIRQAVMALAPEQRVFLLDLRA